MQMSVFFFLKKTLLKHNGDVISNKVILQSLTNKAKEYF